MRADVAQEFDRLSGVSFKRLEPTSLKNKPKRRPSVWAPQVRKMPIGGPISGDRIIPYSNVHAPHCVEPMDAADDPSVRMIVLWLAIREAKTTVCLNIMGRNITDAPCGMFSVHPTDSDANKFESDDLEPMINNSLEEYFVQKKSRDTGRTKEFKKYRGGSIRIFSAGSITKFRGSTVGGLFLHEADGLLLESIYKAFGRTTGIADAVIVMESTGTYAPEIDADGKKIYRSVIHEHYEKGDQRKWFVECVACGHWQVIRYGHFRYPPGEMAKTLCHCEKCDYGHTEPEWRKMAAAGRWYATAGLSDEEIADIQANHHKAKPKQPEIRSYWRNGFTSLLPKSKGYATKLHQFVAEGEAAKGSPEALKTWTNEIAAELWSRTGEGEAPPAWKTIFDRREDYGRTVPARGLFLAAFIDVHKDRLELGWQAWGRREESWCMDRVVIPGFVGDHEGPSAPWRLLRRELARRFPHALGLDPENPGKNTVDLALGMALIDGGKYADEVYRFLRGLAQNPEPGVSQKVRASKGIGQHGHPIVDHNWKTVAKVLKGHHIGTWEAKDRVYERLRMTPEQNDIREGVLHINLQYSEGNIRQMVAETVTVTIEKGQEVRKYENKQALRNEDLDILVGCLAAVRLFTRPWDLLEADLKERAASAKIPRMQPKAEPESDRNESVVIPGW